MIHFPFAEYWWFYLSFVGFVLAVLALDLGVFNKKAHEISFKEASLWTIVWISLALIFNLLFYHYTKNKFETSDFYQNLSGFDGALEAKNLALEFLTGFLVEKSLSVDNIFIFAMVFGYFGIPKKYQHRVLFWGILGALVFRAIFVSIGSVLMQFHGVVLFFGALLILTGAKMFFAGSAPQSLENNFIVKMLGKVFKISKKIDGEKFFIKENGITMVTPLFVGLAFLEVTDLIFAVDSVPAIFSLTKEPLIVFTSNIFAILGLRSLYFMIAGFMDKFVFIKYGLASVLIFVGLKMVYLNQAFGGKFPINWSLGLIGAMIGSSVLASLIYEKYWHKRHREY